MRRSIIMTKQGVRNLNPPGRSNPTRVRREFVCPHVWETFTTWDCREEYYVNGERCGMCHETRGI